MNNDILKLLNDRYFLKNESTWEELAERVGSIYPEIIQDIKDMNFIPGSPFLMNANTNGERKGTLSSCFPMNIEDSIDNIMDSMKEAAEVTRMGGGVGYDFTTLRGKNELVKGNGKNSGGVISFIGIYDAVLDGIKQGGARRGAGMSMLSIYHPQILDFINAKKDKTKFNRSNFSVKIPNKFYKTLEKEPNKIFKTINVVDKKENDLIDNDGKVYTYKMIWDKIIENAWTMAEPGIINSDYILDRVTISHINNLTLCNPCSEFITTVPYSPCCLGSIDVSKFVINNEFDYSRFNILIRKATQFLDASIDVNEFPIQKIKDVALSHRPIGLGMMGFAHLLYKLNIPYNSKEAKDFAYTLMEMMTMVSMDESINLAKDKGSFKWYNEEVFLKANERLRHNSANNYIFEKLKKYGCRNSSQTSIAPTGSISTIATCSSGIEPVFGLVYTRKIETGNKTYTEIFVIDPIFEKFVEEKYQKQKDDIYKYVANNKGSCQECKFLTKEEQKIFVVAGDITPDEHVDILEIFAKYVSLSVSKTINVPKEATIEDISKVYLSAHKKGIIGVTVYRDGCREGILVHNNSDDSDNEVLFRKDAPRRPQELECDMFLVKVKDDYIAVLVGKLKGMLYEMFVGGTNEKLKEVLKEHKLGKIIKVKKNHYRLYHNEDILIEDLGKFGSTVERSLARFISMSLRHGVPLKFIVEQLNKSDDFMSFDKSVSRVLKQYIKDGEVYESEVCPECKNKLVYYDGCIKCSNCFWSKCG